MGNRIDHDLRGIAFLDAAWTESAIDSDESTYTEADPRPGSSTSDASTSRAEPQVLGAQAVPVWLIGTRAGGFPGIGPAGGSPAYYLDGETAANARHHRPPILITDLYTENDQALSSVVCTVPLSGKVLFTWVDDTSQNPVYVWDPDGEDVTTAASTAPSTRGTMATIPRTTRVLWVDEYAGKVWFSDDYGESWTEYADFVSFVPTSGSYDFDDRPRFLAFDGQGQLVWCGKRSTTDVYEFYTSPDLGMSWAQSATLTASVASMSAHPDGTIALVYTDASDVLQFVNMGSGDDDPSLADAVAVASSLDNREHAVCVDEDGAIWLYYGLDTGVAQAGIRYQVSWDRGATWTAPAYNNVTTPDTVDSSLSTTGEPRGLAAAASMGHVFLCHGTADTGGIVNEHHNTCLILGGWQGPYHEAVEAVTTGGPLLPRDPAYRLNGGETLSAVRSLLWYATHNDPGGAGSSITTTGSGGSETYTSAEGGIRQVVASGATYYRSQTFTFAGSDNKDVLLRYVVTVVEDQGTTDLQVRVEGDTHSFALRHTDSTIEVYDIDDSAVIGDAITVPANERLRVEVYYDESEGAVRVLWCSMEATTNKHRTALASESRTLTGSHSATGTAIVRWGRLVGGSGETTWEWRFLNAYARFLNTGLTPVSLLTGRDGWGRPVDGTWPVALPDAYDTANDRVARLAMRGGPLMRADTYYHDTAPDYPIEAVFPDSSPSPYSAWRSVDKTADVDLAVTLGEYDTLPAGAHSWLVLVHRANVRRIRVDGIAAGGSYSTLGTVDLATGFTACSYALQGRILRPDSPYTGTDGARYIAPGELRDGHVILDPSGTPKLRKIVTNTGGWWDGESGTVKARITLDGIDGTESASGDVVIVWPSGVMALHRTSSSPEVAGLRFTIDQSADDAPDAYYEAGLIAVFGLHPTGKQWSDGWEWDKTPNVQRHVDAARVERRSTLGPTQRTLTLDWSDGFVTQKYRDAGQTDYQADSTAAFPLVTRDEVLAAVWEWQELSDGYSRPVLWCGQVPGSGTTLTDPTLWLYGYLMPQGARAQQFTGDEGIGEAYRLSGIQIVEGV